VKTGWQVSGDSALASYTCFDEVCEEEAQEQKSSVNLEMVAYNANPNHRNKFARTPTA
jgi:hypothetical protein